MHTALAEVDGLEPAEFLAALMSFCLGPKAAVDFGTQQSNLNYEIFHELKFEPQSRFVWSCLKVNESDGLHLTSRPSIPLFPIGLDACTLLASNTACAGASGNSAPC